MNVISSYLMRCVRMTGGVAVSGTSLFERERE